MIFCEYTNIRALWEKHFDSMAEDYRHVHGNSSNVEQFVLWDIVDIVSWKGKDIRNYGLPTLHQSGKIIYIFCFMPSILINIIYTIKFILNWTLTDI